MRPQLLFLLFISAFLSVAVRGQSSPATIRGVVRDSVSRATLEEATVTLYSWPAWRVIAVRRNGPRGFLIRAVGAGEYRLVGTYLGYLPDTVAVAVRAGDSVLIPRLWLRRDEKALMQVVVTAHIPPAIVRHDTVAFNAAAYPTQPHATLEDLLRKLPGIDVDKDGNVTMQGKKVDKVFIDGKEFLLNDPRTATQNVPAEIIDRVEAFDSQSDRARLTGIKAPTGTKSINIRLKKGRRRGYFGQLYAGTGAGAAANPSSPLGAYTAGGDAMVLGSKMAFVSGNGNNINNQFTGRESRNGPGTGGIQTLNAAEMDLREEAGRLEYTIGGGTNGNQYTQ